MRVSCHAHVRAVLSFQLLVAAFLSSPARADGNPSARTWAQVKAKEGCLFNWAYKVVESEAEFRQSSQFTYAGTGCVAGKFVTGEGTLTWIRTFPDNPVQNLGFTGRFNNGVLEGSVKHTWDGNYIGDYTYLGGCTDGQLEESLCTPFSGVASVAPEEPGPLGLRDMPAKVAEPARAATSNKPIVVPGRHEGGFADCLVLKMDEPVLNKENDWVTEFELINNCGEELLIQMDAAEFDEGEPNPIGYYKAQFPASWGIPNNAVWPDDYELPADLGFQPHMRRGEGAIQRNYPPKSYLVDGHGPRRTIKYYIVACPLMNAEAQRQNIMFISGSRLMDSGVTFKCVPHPLRRD